MLAYLEFDHVSKMYTAAQAAISDFSLQISQGEFVVIIGPSGCGKSTLLRMLAGLEELSAGEIRLNGERLDNRAPKDRNISMVFQDYALYPHMTVYDNLGFGLKIAGIKKKDIDTRVIDIAKKLKLESYLKRKPSQLSGGQKQRVALGRALIKEPQLLLMDEPLSNLDAQLRMEMRFEIASLHKEMDSTILYVTHDQIEAMTLADTIVVMNGGVIQQLGSPQEIYDHPNNLFVAKFLGNIALNTLDAAWADQHIQACRQAREFRQLSDNQSLLYGIRAEHLELHEDPHGFPVLFVENYGSESVYHMELPATEKEYCSEVCVRMNSSQLLDTNKRYALALKDRDKLMIFDKDSGEALISK